MKEETNFGYLVYLPIVRRFSSECYRDPVVEMLMRLRLRQYFRDIEKALLKLYHGYGGNASDSVVIYDNDKIL